MPRVSIQLYTLMCSGALFNPNAIGVGAKVKRVPRTPMALRLNISLKSDLHKKNESRSFPMKWITGFVGALALGWLVCGRAVGQEKAEPPRLVLDARGHTANVKKVLFTPDGRELITVSDDKTIRFWDVATGEPLRTLRPPIGPGSEGQLYAAAVSPDGGRLAVGGYGLKDDYGVIFLISLSTTRIERRLIGHTNGVVDLAFSHDNRRLVSGSFDKTSRIWDVVSGDCLHVLEGHTAGVAGVTFSPDGLSVATASYDNTARLWSSPDFSESSAIKLSSHTDDVICVAWSPNGETIATGSCDQSIRLWTRTGVLHKTFAKLGNQISSLVFTPDNRSLLFTLGGPAKREGAAILDLTTGNERLRFERHTYSVYHGNVSSRSHQSLLTASRSLSTPRESDFVAATTGGHDSETFLWGMSDGTVLHRLASQGRATFSAAWGSNGKTIAWGNVDTGKETETYLNGFDELQRAFNVFDLELPTPSTSDFKHPTLFGRAKSSDGSTSLVATSRTNLDVRRGNETVTTIKLANAANAVRCFTLVPDNHAAVGTDMGMYLYDTQSGQIVRRFQGHTGIITAISPSPDDRWLLSASLDQTLRIWDPNRDEPLLSLFFAGDDWIAWTPEGYYAGSPGGEKLMGWHVNNGREQMASFYPAAQFRKTLYRPDVIKLLLKTGSVERALEVADQARSKRTEKAEVAQVLPPTVTITAPDRSGVQLSRSELTVTATARNRVDHPVTALRLLLDGRPFEGLKGIKKVANPKLGEVRETWTVQLEPGRHRLKVLADSAVSQGASEEVEVDYVGGGLADMVELPKLYVLAIGISKYPGNLKLDYAASDAQAISTTLQAKSKPLFKSIEVKTLVDQGATRAEILKGLGWLRRQITQRDFGIVFYGGHGEKDADGTLYLLPVDVAPDDLLSTAVTAEQFKTQLTGLPGKIMLLLDACHSGAVDTAKDKGKRRDGGSLTDDLVRDLLTDESGVVVMCASTGREFSLENHEFRHGTFTQAVLEGLSGKGGKSPDGAVFLHHLDSYVTDRVKELTRGQQHPVTSRPSSIRSFPLAKP